MVAAIVGSRAAPAKAGAALAAKPLLLQKAAAAASGRMATEDDEDDESDLDDGDEGEAGGGLSGDDAF